MRQLRTLAIVIAALSSVASLSVVPASAASNASVYWGVYVEGAPANTALMDQVESSVGKRAALEMFGEPWMMNGQMMAFPQAYMDTIRSRGTIPVLDWASQQLGYGNTQPAFALNAVTGGSYDAYLTQWARAAAAWNKPFFMRFDAEMNGWWSPWSEQLNGNHPGDFVRMWQHVHDIFVAQGARNVTWVWCPNIVGPHSTSMSELYPGDNYVDWTCMDGYNWGTDRNNEWQTFNQVFAGSSYNGWFNTYQLLQQTASSKPIMIAETASSENGGSKAAWISDMLTTQLPNNFPKIKAFLWFDWNENDPGLTWPLSTSTTATQAFANGIGSSYYASNDFGSITGPIQALSGAATAPEPAPAPPPAPAPAPPTASANSATLTPVADTYTTWFAPNWSGGGGSTVLAADLEGYTTAFLKFDLSSIAGKTLTSVTLRIHTSTESWATVNSRVNVKGVYDTGWYEQWMTFNNTVAVSPTILGWLNLATATDTWYDVPLYPSLVQPYVGHLTSMALQGTASDLLIFDSRESGANAPQLVLNYK